MSILLEEKPKQTQDRVGNFYFSSMQKKKFLQHERSTYNMITLLLNAPW